MLKRTWISVGEHCSSKLLLVRRICEEVPFLLRKESTCVTHEKITSQEFVSRTVVWLHPMAMTHMQQCHDQRKIRARTPPCVVLGVGGSGARQAILEALANCPRIGVSQARNVIHFDLCRSSVN